MEDPSFEQLSRDEDFLKLPSVRIFSSMFFYLKSKQSSFLDQSCQLCF